MESCTQHVQGVSYCRKRRKARRSHAHFSRSEMSVCNVEKERLLLMPQAALLIQMIFPAAAITIPIAVLKTSDQELSSQQLPGDGWLIQSHPQSIQYCCLVPPREGDGNLQVARCVTLNTGDCTWSVYLYGERLPSSCLLLADINLNITAST